MYIYTHQNPCCSKIPFSSLFIHTHLSPKQFKCTFPPLKNKFIYLYIYLIMMRAAEFIDPRVIGMGVTLIFIFMCLLQLILGFRTKLEGCKIFNLLSY